MKTLILIFVFLMVPIYSELYLPTCPYTIEKPKSMSNLLPSDLPWDLALNSSNLNFDQLTSILTILNYAVHNQTDFYWNYARNLNDGRGITFGILGFTSGCYNGRDVIQKIYNTSKYQGLSHSLALYHPAFVNIDNTEHDLYGNMSLTPGLENFTNDFSLYGADEISKKAQLDTINELYWQPAIEKARELKVNHSSTLTLFFDICLSHGCDADGFNNKGLTQFINETDVACGKSLLDGYDERKWAKKLSEVRINFMQTQPDLFNNSIRRAEVIRKIANGINYNLTFPLNISCVDEEISGMKLNPILLVKLLVLAYILFGQG